MWELKVSDGRVLTLRGPDQILIKGEPIGHARVQGDLLRACQAFKVPALLRSIVFKYEVEASPVRDRRFQVVELKGGGSRLRTKWMLPKGAKRLPNRVLEAMRNVFSRHIAPDAALPAEEAAARQQDLDQRKLEAAARARAAISAARRTTVKEASP